MNGMKKINFNDNLFVNVILRGRSLLNVKLTGFDSFGELMIYLRTVLGEYAGQLLSLELRNATKGWSRRDSVLFAA